jgi:hypothetical protein
MPIIKMSPEDFDAMKPLEPGWYPATLAKFNIEQNKAGDNINLVCDFTLDAYPKRPSKRTWVTSKFLSTYEQFVFATTGEHLTKENPDFNTDEVKVGSHYLVELDQDVYNGRPVNNIVGFLPVE